MYMSVVLALAFTVGVFIILPTGGEPDVGRCLPTVFSGSISRKALSGYCCSCCTCGLFPFMGEIKRVFQYHGAEHKTIHCYESGLELTPENCRQFPTLHPRCGTSFLMFVFIISFSALHFLLGWPNLALRIISRLLLLPVIAGLSLMSCCGGRGKGDSLVVKILSIPGLYLQKITTKEPDDKQLEVAIASINAVLEAEGKKPPAEPASPGRYSKPGRPGRFGKAGDSQIDAEKEKIHIESERRRMKTRILVEEGEYRLAKAFCMDLKDRRTGAVLFSYGDR